MADAYKKLYQGQPGTSAATVYTAPASTTTIIRHIRAVNTHTAEQTIELWDDGTADVNKILPAVSIGPDDMYAEDCFICVAAADTIAAKASIAAEVTLTFYGVEIT